jgi:hypothetical protein
MAVSKIAFLTCAWMCCAVATTAVAENATGDEPGKASQTAHSRLYELLTRQLQFARSLAPAWIRGLSFDRINPERSTGDDDLQLVLQQGRPDGTDLLTLRYPIVQNGAMRAYAGAGLNQAAYFSNELGAPEPLSRRNRNRSIGAAAELGAEFRASDRLLLGAGLRWAELDSDAVQLASGSGPVGADALSVGVSLGWRFR